MTTHNIKHHARTAALLCGRFVEASVFVFLSLGNDVKEYIKKRFHLFRSFYSVLAVYCCFVEYSRILLR